MRRVLATVAVVVAGAALAPAPAAAAPSQSHLATGSSATASVIGGRVASIAEFPWIAFIVARPSEGTFTCTGAVVAPRVVLTAGHCVEKEGKLAANSPSSYRVVTGIANVDEAKGGNVSTVERAIFYPKFETAKVQVDAGLLILSKPLAVPTLRLAGPADSAAVAAGTPVSIAGWGVVAPRAQLGPSVLRAGGLVLKPARSCRRATREFEPFFSARSQVCAIDPHRRRTVSGCFGDSGGPAVATGRDGAPVEVGIVVSGAPSCDPELPNILTRVADISGWISRWISSVERGTPAPPAPTVGPPLLTFERARQLGAAALASSIGRGYRQGVEKRTRCERLGWASVRCAVAWRRGERRYRGAFSVHLEVHGIAVTARTLTRINVSVRR